MLHNHHLHVGHAGLVGDNALAALRDIGDVITAVRNLHEAVLVIRQIALLGVSLSGVHGISGVGRGLLLGHGLRAGLRIHDNDVVQGGVVPVPLLNHPGALDFLIDGYDGNIQPRVGRIGRIEAGLDQELCTGIHIEGRTDIESRIGHCGTGCALDVLSRLSSSQIDGALLSPVAEQGHDGCQVCGHSGASPYGKQSPTLRAGVLLRPGVVGESRLGRGVVHQGHKGASVMGYDSRLFELLPGLPFVLEVGNRTQRNLRSCSRHNCIGFDC